MHSDFPRRLFPLFPDAPSSQSGNVAVKHCNWKVLFQERRFSRLAAPEVCRQAGTCSVLWRGGSVGERVGLCRVGRAALGWHSLLWPRPRLDRLRCWGGQNRLEVTRASEGVVSKQFGEIAIPEFAPVLDSCLSFQSSLLCKEEQREKCTRFLYARYYLLMRLADFFFEKHSFFFFLSFFFSSLSV